MTKTYDDILQDYEERGIIPLCSHVYTSGLLIKIYHCPYCGAKFSMWENRNRVLHCPDCCMEIRLG
jgi:hypothetical protein